jgi:hypothetical protein
MDTCLDVAFLPQHSISATSCRTHTLWSYRKQKEEEAQQKALTREVALESCFSDAIKNYDAVWANACFHLVVSAHAAAWPVCMKLQGVPLPCGTGPQTLTMQ